MIEDDGTEQFDQNTSDRYVETIKKSFEGGEQIRVSDIITFAANLEAVKAQTTFDEIDSLKDSVSVLTKAIISKEVTQTSEAK